MEANSQNQEKRQENQITPRSSERGLDSTIFFGQNKHFAFIYKKTEKLVTAVYMITNFIKDNEPLKWKIRESALSLMEINLDFNTVSLSERRDLLKEYQALALEIVSFSAVAHHSGLISEMNFTILSREFNNLVTTIEKDENRQANDQTVILDPSFFDTPASDVPEKEISYKGHVPEAATISRVEERTAPVFPIKDISDRPQKSTPKQVRTPEAKDGRQASIIKLLSKKGGLNIKDFSESITGCSEKTIQRELLAMVAAGVLKKEGERRWSTYSLA